MEEVVVTAQKTYSGGLTGATTKLGVLDTGSVFDTPFSITSLTSQLVEDRALQSLVDLDRYDASVTASSSRSSFYDGEQIRGFSTIYLYDGLIGPFARGTALSVDEFDRIDIIKGSAESLAGALGFGPGGAINLAPKRAGDEPIRSLDLRYLSGSAFGAHLDVGQRFGADQAFGARFNGTVGDGDINIDHVGVERVSGALALDYHTSTVRLNLDLNALHTKNAGAQTTFYIDPSVPVPRAPRLDQTYSQSWVDYPINRFFGVLRAEWDVRPNVTLGYDVSGERHNEHGTYEGSGTILDGAGDYDWNTGLNYDYNIDGVDQDIYLKAKATTGPLHHAITVQGSYGTSIGYFSTVYDNFDVISNLYAPIVVPRPPDPADFPVAKGLDSARSSLIVADQIDAFADRVLLTLAGRWTDIRQRRYDGAPETLSSDIDNTAFTPVVALVVKPIRPLSLYVSYAQGLEYGAVAPLAAANRNDVTAAISSTTYEAGAKLDLGRLGLTAAVFDITRQSPLLDPVTKIFALNGEEEHKGFEAQAFGTPAKGLKLLAGVTIMDPTLNKTQDGQYDGKQAPGVPRFRAVGTAELETPWIVRGLSIYGSVSRTNGWWLDAGNIRRVPGYTLGDLGAIFKATLAGKPTTWRLSVENVADTRYWSGTSQGGGELNLGTPRTILASVSLNF